MSMLVRKDERIVGEFLKNNLTTERLVAGSGSAGLEATVVIKEGHASRWETDGCARLKCYHVLEGKLQVIVDARTHNLEEGDSIYLESNTPHIWRNPEKDQAKILIVTHPPEVSRQDVG